MKPQDAQLTEAGIDQILANLDITHLGDWERSFFTSVQTYWKKNRKLSPKQSKRLAEMWKKVHEPKS
jgi:hypothetical protein